MKLVAEVPLQLFPYGLHNSNGMEEILILRTGRNNVGPHWTITKFTIRKLNNFGIS